MEADSTTIPDSVDMREWSKQFHAVLVMRMEGEANEKVQNEVLGNGYLAWNKIHRHYDVAKIGTAADT